MNGNLRNKHAEFQMKYIAVAEKSIIPDLHTLRQRQFQYEPGGPQHHAGAPELVDWQGRACWEAQNPDSFLFYLWEYQELYRRFNCEFVSLTPSNLFTCQCVVMSTIMYRIGHGNPNYTRMGMCNSVMNAGGKLPCAVEGSKKRMSDVRKLTGAGLDYVNNAVNLFRSMYGAYLNVHTEGNKQRVRNIRRTTEGSLYDYVTFMDGKIINAPTNVGEDTAMTEGPSARKENLEGLFNQIDRDDDPHNSIMNTVDLNQNNNRKQTTAEPLAGWKLFLVLIGVNNTFEAVLQTRYQQMLIACNPVCASAPNDDFWTMRVSAGGDVDEGADYDRMDEMQLHKGGINQVGPTPAPGRASALRARPRRALILRCARTRRPRCPPAR